MIDEARRLYAGDKDAQVKAPGTEVISKIKWSEVDLPEDQYVLRPMPTSIFPESVAAKLQFAIDMLEGGMLDRRQALALIDHPDTRSALDLDLGEQQSISRVIHEMLDTGVYTPPEPFQNVAMAKQLATNSYFRATNDGVKDERLQLILMYLSDLETIQSLQAPPAPAPAQEGQEQVPQQVPGSPPVDDAGVPISGGSGLVASDIPVS